jgi:hypothetical protein
MSPLATPTSSLNLAPAPAPAFRCGWAQPAGFGVLSQIGASVANRTPRFWGATARQVRHLRSRCRLPAVPPYLAEVNGVAQRHAALRALMPGYRWSSRHTAPADALVAAAARLQGDDLREDEDGLTPRSGTSKDAPSSRRSATGMAKGLHDSILEFTGLDLSIRAPCPSCAGRTA